MGKMGTRKPCASCAELEDQVRELSRELDARRDDIRELEQARRSLREESAWLRLELADTQYRLRLAADP